MEGMAPRVAPLDTTVEIVTPENIAFRYRLAGPFRRLPALLIDVMIQVGCRHGGVYRGAMLVSGTAGLPGMGLAVAMVFWFVLFWFYGGLFETFWNGQTPGKRLLGIRVITLDGQPINALQAILRNVLRIVDAQPVMLLSSRAVGGGHERPLSAAGRPGLRDDGGGRGEGIGCRGWCGSARPRRCGWPALIPANFQVSRSLGAGPGRLRAAAAGLLARPAAGDRPPRRRAAPPASSSCPPGTDLDMLLCGLYQRAFITDHDEAGRRADRRSAGRRCQTPPFMAARSRFLLSETPSMQFLEASP